MRNRTRVLYLGTYERDYPRNVLVIAAFRKAGFDVRALHASIWSGQRDKTRLLSSPLALMWLGLRLVVAYLSLFVRLLRCARSSDLVVFGYIGQLDVLVLAPLARLLRKPIIFNPLVTLSDTLVEDRKKFAPDGLMARVLQRIDWLALRLSDLILVDTHENGEYLRSRFGVDSARLRVLPVGADETVFASERTVPPVENAQLTVLFYGTMIPLQGVETIVRAAKLLDRDAVRVEIVGSGQMLPSVRALATELDIRNVTWVERVPYAELPERIARADVVLGIFGASAKAARVVPNKVYQAMAMGAAIVTRDSAAQRAALTDGQSALLVPPADAGALADAIRRLQDPELRCMLGASARTRFDNHFSLNAQSNRLCAALESVLPDAPSRHPGSVPV